MALELDNLPLASSRCAIPWCSRPPSVTGRHSFFVCCIPCCPQLPDRAHQPCSDKPPTKTSRSSQPQQSKVNNRDRQEPQSAAAKAFACVTIPEASKFLCSTSLNWPLVFTADVDTSLPLPSRQAVAQRRLHNSEHSLLASEAGVVISHPFPTCKAFWFIPVPAFLSVIPQHPR